MNRKPISYLQTDPAWGELPYAVKGENTTIAHSGCGPTAAAMIIATLVDPAITPVEACAWAVKKGYKCLGNGTYYSFFAAYGQAYGLLWQQINWSNLQKMKAASAQQYHQQALSAVENGDMVIALMGPGTWTRSGHFILWYGMDGNDALINDPASTKMDRVRNSLTRLQAEVKYYFICHTPEEKKEETPMTEDQVKNLVAASVAEALEKYKEGQWYPTIMDVPPHYQPSVRKLMEAGILKGYDEGSPATLDDNTLRVDENFCRIVTILDRAGALGLAQ